MSKKLFERKEMKYLLTKDQAQHLVHDLTPYLEPDPYPEYDIWSIYFDNNQWELFRRSTDKPIYKEKLRLRSYGKNENAFFEIKKKYEGVVYKRRIDLKTQDIQKYLYGQHSRSLTASEIDCMIQRYHLMPKIFISYHRKAWVWKNDKEFRITLDNNIQYRTDHLRLDVTAQNEDLFDQERYILELKSTANFPMEIVKVLNNYAIYPASISKAGSAYKKLLAEGEI